MATVELTINKPTTGRDDRSDYIGWYTIRIKATRCSGCGHLIITSECDVDHTTVVWEEKDDENLLVAAGAYQRYNLHPKVVEYEPSMGKCINFYDAVKQGKIS